MESLSLIAIMNNEKNDSMPHRIAFFGTPEFASIILDSLIKANFIPMVVITKPDAPVGRKKILTPSFVKRNLSIPSLTILTPDRLDDDFCSLLESFHIDVALVAAYGKIFPKKLLDIPKKGCLNVHASLLPLYRGASPIQNAILDERKQTGVTLMHMEPGLDTGPILESASIPILDSDTTETLMKKLALLGGALAVKTLPLWLEDRIEPKKQEEEQATYCTVIHKKDGHIDWKQNARTVYTTYRAFTPWPGVYSFVIYKGKNIRIKLLDIELDEAKNFTDTPGSLLLEGSSLRIVAGDGKSILIRTLQIEGKNPLSSSDFLSGYKDMNHAILF